MREFVAQCSFGAADELRSLIYISTFYRNDNEALISDSKAIERDLVESFAKVFLKKLKIYSKDHSKSLNEIFDSYLSRQSQVSSPSQLELPLQPREADD